MDAPWYTSSGYDVMVKCVPKLFFLLFYLNRRKKTEIGQLDLQTSWKKTFMNIKAILFLLSCVISAAKAGHYLFWVGTAGKSDNIGMMLIAEELAQRGHEATLVFDFFSVMTKDVEGITEIVNLPESTKKLYEKYGNITKKWSIKDWNTLKGLELTDQISIEKNRNLMRHPQVEELLRTKHVDVLIAYPDFANEASYLLAKKKNASLVMFTRFMQAQVFVNWANGDPFNPSYMMNYGINPYEPPMIFQPGSNQRMTFLGRILVAFSSPRQHTSTKDSVCLSIFLTSS